MPERLRKKHLRDLAQLAEIAALLDDKSLTRNDPRPKKARKPLADARGSVTAEIAQKPLVEIQKLSLHSAPGSRTCRSLYLPSAARLRPLVIAVIGSTQTKSLPGGA